MLSAAVMRYRPLWVNDRRLARLDNAITGAEPCLDCGLSQFEVRPLIAMIVYVVGDLAKKDAIRS